LQYWGRSNTHQHWFAIWLQLGQKFFNVTFCSYLHLQYFNWAAVPGGRFSNSPTSQSPIVGSNFSATLNTFIKTKILNQKHMKGILVIAFILFGGQFIFAQDTTKIIPKPATVKLADNYTIQRLIVYNDKKEILMEKNWSGWQTPALRSNQNQSLKEGIDSMAKTIGISIDPIKLSGIFTYKYEGLPDHKEVSYRTHYSAKYKSGELIQTKDKEYKWIPIKEAIDKIGMEALKSETNQIVTNPKTIWGGSFLLTYKDGKLQTLNLVEPFYPLSGK
jgi:hypothetical protein